MSTQSGEKATRTDAFGDPLPPGAIARMGTIRWRIDSGGATQLAVPANGETVLVANGHTGVSIWNLATGRELRRSPAKEAAGQAWLDPQTSVALSADGRIAAFGAKDGVMHVLDVDADKELCTCQGHRGKIQEAALSRDGRILVTRSEDKTLRIWDAVAGKQLHEAPLESKAQSQYQPHEIAVAADGQTFAWIGNDKERVIRLHDTATGVEKQRLGQHEGSYRHLLVSPAGGQLVSTSDNGRIQQWDMKTGKLTRTWTSGGSWGPPSAAFAPDGKTLIVTRGNDAMRLLDVATGKETWSNKLEFGSTQKDAFAFTPDGKTLLAVHAGEGLLRRYDMATGKPLRTPGELTTWIHALAFSPDEKLLHTFQWDRVWRTWETATGKEVRQLVLHSRQIAFAPGGGLLAEVKEKEGVVYLHDTATGRELRRLPEEQQNVSAIVFAPDNRTLLVQGNPAGIVLWDATTGKQLRRLAPADVVFDDFAFAADGKRLVGFGHQADDLIGFVQVWDVATGRPRGPRLALPARDFYHRMILSPDARTLVLSGDNQNPTNLNLWDIANGQRRLVIREEVAMRPPVGRFSPDGSMLLIPEPTGFNIYDAFTGKSLHQEPGHPGIVAQVAFSPSGRWLATANLDFTALVWRTADILDPIRPKPVALSGAELVAAWAELTDSDGEKAYAALGKLVRSPREAAPWLREHVRLVRALADTDRKRLQRLLSELDSEEFDVRKRAAAEIEKFGATALPLFDEVLAGNPSQEVRASVEKLKEKCQPEKTGTGLRSLRTVEVLEHIGTPEARQVLEDLAKGLAEARLTREAKAALERLKK